MTDPNSEAGNTKFPFSPGASDDVQPVRLSRDGNEGAPRRSSPGVRLGVPSPVSARPVRDSSPEGVQLPGRVSKTVRKGAGAQSEKGARETASPNVFQREERIAVSFPGLMKVLAPEVSFLPVTIAVRVTNLSAGGAMIEIHERSSNIDRSFVQPHRFVELKVAHHEVPDLRGTIAWTDFSGSQPALGLSCFERHAELAEMIRLADTKFNFEGPKPLPVPQIDPFPPASRQKIVRISGTAVEGLEILCKRDEKRFTAKVVNDRFHIDLELDPATENAFSLRSVAGERRSLAIPLRIDYAAGTKGGKGFRFDSRIIEESSSGGQSIRLDFRGDVRQAERILYRFSQLMSISETVALSATLNTSSEFDRRMFDALKSEGTLLAKDDTHNSVASQLLDDMM